MWTGTGWLEAKHILIATGARPLSLGFSGEEHLVTNEEFLEMDQLPNRIVLVGGGYIAAEFSHIVARAGAKVTVLQRGKRMLMQFDADLVSWLMESFHRVGIDVRTKRVVETVEKKSSNFIVRATTGSGVQTFEADLVVHAAGHIPDLEHLTFRPPGSTVTSTVTSSSMSFFRASQILLCMRQGMPPPRVRPSRRSPATTPRWSSAI